MKEKKEQTKQIAIRGLAAFLIVMMCFTVLSRLSDSVTVPKVETSTVKSGKIEQKIEKSGVLQPKDEDSLAVGAGLVVKQIFVEQGMRVTKGEALLELDAKEVQGRLTSANGDLEKLQLRKQQLDLNEQFEVGLTPVEGVLEKIKRLEEDRVREVEVQDKQVAKCEEQVAQAEEKLVEAEGILEEFKENNAAKQLEEAKKKVAEATSYLSDQKYEQEKALRRAQQAVDHAQNNLHMTEGDITMALQALESARLEYNLVRSDWERNVKKAEDSLKEAKATLEKVEKGELDPELLAQEEAKVLAAKENVIAKQSQLADAVGVREDKGIDFERQLADAQKDLERAEKEEEGAAKKDQQDEKRQAIEKALMEIDIQEKQREIKKLKEVLAEGGMLVAPSDGVVTALKVEKGDKTSDGEIVTFVGDDSSYKLVVEVGKEEGKWLQIGDEVSVQLDSENRAIEGVNIDNLSYTENGNKKITVVVPEGAPGVGATMVIKRSSNRYDMVLPITSLRENNGLHYVFITTTKQTTLGEQVVVQRMDVKVLDKNQSEVAVEGPLGAQDQIVVKTNKTLMEGDRVRPMVK